MDIQDNKIKEIEIAQSADQTQESVSKEFSPYRRGLSPIGKDLKSPNYKPGVSGWVLRSSGTAEFNQNTFIAGALKVIKYSDETVNNSAVLQADNALTFSVGAVQFWAIDLVIFYDSGTTPDIKFGWTVPSGTTMMWSFTDVDGNVVKTQAEEYSRSGLGAGTKALCHIKAVVITGITSGSVTLTWAQNTADASDTKVLRGSYLIATRLA